MGPFHLQSPGCFIGTAKFIMRGDIDARKFDMNDLESEGSEESG